MEFVRINKNDACYKIRVMHVITGLDIGGAEMMLYKLLAAHLHEPEDVLVVSLGDAGGLGDKIRELGITVDCLGIRPNLSAPIALLAFRRIARSFRPDIIQGWMHHGNLAALLAGYCVTGQQRVLWNIRQSLYRLADEKQLTRGVIRGSALLSTRADTIIYNSKLSKIQHEQFGFSPQRGKLIPNGFDMKHFAPSVETRLAVRYELGIPLDAPVVGHIARFHPMKDHALFLRAAVYLYRRNPKIHFLLCGNGVDHNNPEITRYLCDFPKEQMHLLGERYDIARLMQAMDVFCLSSVSESFPNVLGEAMACGVVCVTTDVGDSGDIVGEHGRVVPARNEAALSEAVV